jgi:hypothetical protein
MTLNTSVSVISRAFSIAITACGQLGIAEIPVMVAAGWTEAQMYMTS